MLKSIEYCHSHNIVHRDVKMENFLIDATEDDTIEVKLSDFGLACKYQPHKSLTAKCGSLLAIAPEMLSS